MSKIILLIVSICVMNSAEEITKTLYMEHLKFENDKMYAAAIMHDIIKINNSKPLIFIGVRENPKLKFEYYIEAAEVNISIFNWDRYNNKYAEIFVKRPYYFLREQGYDVIGYFEQHLPNINLENIVFDIKNQVQDMNVYPHENSIKEQDEYILIKIGNTTFEEKYDES